MCRGEIPLIYETEYNMNEETTFYTTVYYVGLFKNSNFCYLLSGPYVEWEDASTWMNTHELVDSCSCYAQIVEQGIELHL